jgi:glycyl-tRNA synthetase beta chain
MAAFLLEVGVEEIPDWMIEPALAELSKRFEKLLEEERLGGRVEWVDATPRRLVLKASGLAAAQADSKELVTGPPKSAGAGAAQGFAKKMGTTVDQLSTASTDKGEYLSFEKQTKGRSAAGILAESLPGIVTTLYFPKTMYWTGKGGVRFIRPIRWIVALLDNAIVPFEIAGVRSGAATRGHRVLGAPAPIDVTIETYETKLRENFVVLRASERRARIAAGLGQDVEPDPALLNTLVYLTEWPSPIRGSFDASYLALPKEILTTVMRHHQRYFSVLDSTGALAPEFVAVTNTDGDPEGLIRHGNQRVLRARFNDAQFFWQVDQQKKLADRVGDLKKVTFQAKLEKPTYFDKTQRVVSLAGVLAEEVASGVLDRQALERAAMLAKTDLVTSMVKEFTELQGIVGGLYAAAQGEPKAVSAAIYDHYRPASMEDAIPRTVEGQVLSIADKLDTLTECFRVGLLPSGSKDPFALRRAAQGVIKILFESRLRIDVTQYVIRYAGPDRTLADFLNERISHYLREVKRFPYDEVNAAMAVPGPVWLGDLEDRITALHSVRATPDFELLAVSFKRIKNILKQAQLERTPEIPGIVEALLAPGPERGLFEAYRGVCERLASLADYQLKLEAIASLRPEVDLFFDKILVNDPDEKIRQNRLALLSCLLTEFSRIADFSEIVPNNPQAG